MTKPVHIGILLRAKVMEAKDLPLGAFAKMLAITQEDLELLINTGASYDDGLAMRLSLVLGGDAPYWRGIIDNGVKPSEYPNL